MVSIELLERLGVEIKPELVELALTHSSYAYENHADHNERLEFLGDSVLNLAVAHLLFTQLSQLPEGDLSRVRANLVKQDTLQALALQIGLPEVIRLGEGELRSGGRKRPSILADAVECQVAPLGLTERGEGRSRRTAEQQAARRMLEGLKASDRPGSPLRS